MFKNYLNVALRNITKNKGYSFINIFGLSVGMASCILILIWVQFQFSFDKFFEDSNSIYRVIVEELRAGEKEISSATCAPLGPTLKQEYMEIKYYSRYDEIPTVVVARDSKKFTESGLILVDPDFFELFSFKFLNGNANQVLSNPNSIVISRDIAAKYFGDENPMGKNLQLGDNLDLTVTGIIENVPANSHMQFSMAALFENIGSLDKRVDGFDELMNNWRLSGFSTYILLNDNVKGDYFEQKISVFLKKYNEDKDEKIFLQPLKDIYLYSTNITYSLGMAGDVKYVYIYSFIAIFILLIACINFMNLTTTRAFDRAKEVGIRKATGANRFQLIIQFLWETAVLISIVMLTSLVLLEIAFPIFNNLSGNELSLISEGILSLLILIFVIGGLTCLICGSYPALLLSSLNLAGVLKGRTKIGNFSINIKKGLVVFQFVQSIVLIVCTIVVSNQLKYFEIKDLGYNKDYLVYFEIQGDLEDKIEQIKRDLVNYPDILSATAISSRPTAGSFLTSNRMSWEGKAPDMEIDFRFVSVDYDYLNTYGIEMKEGRFYSRDFVSDTSAGIVLNETAIKEMGIDSPIGKKFNLFNSDELNIIGVVKDYNFSSLRNSIKPLALIIAPSVYRYVVIKIESFDLPNTLANIETVWNKYATNYPFECRFVDDDYNRMYRVEKRMSDILKYFSLIAIIIAGLGLMGLISLFTKKRTKEIGIRKVLGASEMGIVYLLTKDFIYLVVLANVIAWPISWLVMNRWLESYAYRIDIGIMTFFLAGTA
ncbi:MAG: ABC transporter permease, partial [Candidatus Zixiibacteriota bacterium]